jgi:LEA14-like dessication related protein
MKLNKYILLALVIVFAGCASPKPFVFKGMNAIKIEKASFGKNVFNAQFQYENPNNFELTLKHLDCDVFINDKLFTHYKLDTNYTIPANKAFNLPARMEIELSSLVQNSVAILFNKPMKIAVIGNATLSKGFITKSLPIEFVTEQRLDLKSILSGTN